jgi:hypothetical protein
MKIVKMTLNQYHHLILRNILEDNITKEQSKALAESMTLENILK